MPKRIWMPSPEIVFFTATWAGPARAAAPIFSEVLAELGIAGRIADVDVEAELADRCGIDIVPSVAILDDDQVKVLPGSRPKPELRRWLEARGASPLPPR